MNQVILIGRLTRDPEVRYTGDQMAIASFSLAIDRITRADKEKQTDFPRITAFGRQAELCEKYLTKGRLVAIQGRIQTGSYKNKEGVTVYTTDVVADRVEFIDWGDKGRSGGGDTERSFDRSAFDRPSFDRPSFERPSVERTFSGNLQEPELPEGFTALDDDDDIPF